MEEEEEYVVKSMSRQEEANNLSHSPSPRGVGQWKGKQHFGKSNDKMVKKGIRERIVWGTKWAADLRNAILP